MVLALVQGASAEDGLQGWISSVFGGGGTQPAAQPAPAPGYGARRFPAVRVRLDDRVGRQPGADRPRIAQWQRRGVRPLVVQLRRSPSHASTAQVPAKPEAVSILTDRTLRRGDAVMMADGMRVFAGSTSWPYAKADFVTVADAKHLSRSTTKVLADLNLLPRG